MNPTRVRRGAMGLIAGLCLCGLTNAASFSDDHNDGSLSGWAIQGGRQWQETGSAATTLTGSNNQGFLINSNSCNADGTLEVNVTSDQWNGHKGGIVFRWSSQSSFYFISVLPGNQYSNFIKFVKNSLDAYSPSAITVAQNFPLGTNYTLKVEMLGSTFRIYLDNVLRGTVTDASLSSGKIGYGYTTEWNDYLDFNSIQWTEKTSSVPSAPTNLVLDPVSSSQINLTWVDNSSNEDGFSIECRDYLGETEYRQIATVSQNTTTFSSTGLKAGTLYNFRVRAFNQIGYSSYSPVVAAHTMDANGPEFLIIASSPLYRTGNIASDISQYQQDILADGWTSEVITVNRVQDSYADFVCPSEVNLKNIISGYFDRGLRGFVIVGSPRDIPTAYWRYHERESNPNYNQDPTDLYYADMDEWVDLDTNGIYETYHSVWLRDHWDADLENPANPDNPSPMPELMYGRISLDTTIVSLTEQANLISAYFQKIHNYRVNGSILTQEEQNRSLYMINDCYSGGVTPPINVQDATGQINVLAGYTLLFPERVAEEMRKGFTHAQIITHSGNDGHVLHSWKDEVRSFIGYSLDDVKTSQARIHQINIFGCYAAKFNVVNFGETYIFHNDFALNVTGSTGGWGTWMDTAYYDDLNAGLPIGEAFINFIGRTDGGRPKGILHGDPLLTYARELPNKAPMFTTRLYSHDATAGQVFSLNIFAQDPENDQVTITLTDLPSGAVFDGRTLTWTPSAELVGTSDTIVARVTDSHNNSTELEFTVYVSQFRNPLLESVQGWTVQGSGSTGFNASDPYYTPYGVRAIPLTTNDSWANLSQTVAVKPNHRYRISFWSLNNLSANRASASVRVEDLDVTINVPTATGPDFQYSSATIQTGDRSALTFTLNSGNAGNLTSGDLYFTLIRLVDEGEFGPGLNNGAFENGTGSSPSIWTADPWLPEDAVMNWDEGSGVDGTRCIRITNTGANDSRWTQSISGLVPSAWYVLSGWVKGDSIVNVDNGTIGASLCVMDTWTHSEDGLTGTFDWQQVSFRFQAPESGEVVIGCRLGYWGNTTTGTARFDNLQLTLEE